MSEASCGLLCYGVEAPLPGLRGGHYHLIGSGGLGNFKLGLGVLGLGADGHKDMGDYRGSCRILGFRV